MRGSNPRNRALAGLALLSVTGVVGLSSGQEPAPAAAPKAGDDASALRQATTRFVEAADRADRAAIAATYAPEFACVRVADEGGFARLTREQMLGFFARPTPTPADPAKAGAHAIPTRETTIHHAEAIGDTGFVLLTRVKDLGRGWEPMFYTLVWTRHHGEWRLLREYVHQKSIPRRL